MKILMVCLGNICRSPLAEGIMHKIIQEKKLDWTVQSAGTSSFHSGEKPDPRSIAIAAENGIDINNQRSQLLTVNHFDEFDFIFVMDKSNLKDALALANTDLQKSKIKLFLEFGGSEVSEVPDPYYTKGFDYVYDLINEACENIFHKINNEN